MTLRTLVVDDEPVARRRLRRLLRHDADVQIVGECGDGAAAVEAVRALVPDVVLLDVQMPELDGFGFLQTLAPEEIPVVIFVTAYDRYAVRAFDVHALDYLLKPVDGERLERAMARARIRVADRRGSPARHADDRIMELLTELTSERRYLTRIPVRTEGRLIVVPLSGVDWVAAADNYVTLHAGTQSHMVRETMGRLERELDPDCFVRIHRSTIVRIDRVKELIPDFHGDYTVILKNGTRLTLSRTYRAKLEAVLGRTI
jgi:two-component system LytT family response regulator